jgi:hypothetical protein
MKGVQREKVTLPFGVRVLGGEEKIRYKGGFF